MYALKGFILNKDFSDNTPGIVAKIGEISPISTTFSREKGVYRVPAAPLVSLMSFTSKTDIESTVVVPNDIRDQVLVIANHAYSMTLSQSTVFDPADFFNSITTMFGSEIESLRVGPVVTDGSHYMPEWLEWKSLAIADNNIIKIWFTDEAFRGQYDEYEIVVIPPIVNLNQFFNAPESVKTLLSARTYPEEIQLIQNARGEYPETILWANEYDYVNPHNQSDKTPSKWTVLIYGFAGNDLDVIKGAIVDYVLDNSDHDRDEWKLILPDLFLRTEFVMVPLWDQIAIDEMIQAEGIYSPVMKVATALTRLKDTVTEYSPTHIDTHAEFWNYLYKSIAVMSVGNIENKDGKISLTDWFPDFALLYTGSLNHARMDQKTQDWMTMLSHMFPVAENVTEMSVVPAGYTRSVRDGVLYLAKSFDNVNFLIAAKANW